MMSEIEREIMENFGRIIPTLSDLEKERLLMFSEGMAFKADQQRPRSEQDSA